MRQNLTNGIAAEVRAELARQGHDNTWLASQLGVSDMWVSRRLRGITEFTVSDLVSAAQALNVSVMQLIPIEVPA